MHACECKKPMPNNNECSYNTCRVACADDTSDNVHLEKNAAYQTSRLTEASCAQGPHDYYNLEPVYSEVLSVEARRINNPDLDDGSDSDDGYENPL